MKNVLIAALLGLGLAAHGSAFAAGSASQNFNVSVSLTPACVLGTVADISFTYTGLQAAAATGSGGSFSIQCTDHLPYSFSLDADAGSTVNGTSRTYTDLATLLSYTLTTPDAGTGNGSSQSLSLSSTMAANQAGSCPSATVCTNSASANRSRTLTITY
jgi:spore coat protein U-like protein